MDDTLDIKTLRVEKLEISQAQLAKELGVDQSTISAWETSGLPRNGLVRDAVQRRIMTLVAQKEQAA